MAKGVDELVNYVLSEIALTGVQGAGSVDFKRFIQFFFENQQSEDGSSSCLRPEQLCPLHDKIWQWVTDHADIRITHNGVTRQYTLAEFEAAEKSEPTPANPTSAAAPGPRTTTVNETPGPAKSLLALRYSLRQCLVEEGLSPQATLLKPSAEAQSPWLSQDPAADEQSNISLSQQTSRASRVLPSPSKNSETIFDDPPADTTAPRLFASQNRIWQALTGHGIDLKKVPTMEFVLLSLIASHGVSGVTQPDLTTMSGQDKRSVPHRTDELCRKGYIAKKPVQSGKLRTSLCVHKKFVSEDHFLTSGKVEDVFQYKKFVLSGFVHLLYNTLKDAGVVPTRDIRKRLNVPMTTWNKRAVQGALIRLDQTGMVKRFRARRKDAEDNWLTCIEVLREPRPEDHENLKFRRQVVLEEDAEEQSDEDVDGDTLMRDLEVDILNSASQDAEGRKEEAGRVPPQWIPERLLSNMLYEVVGMGGAEGWDAGVVRDRIVGKFWRRPMESYLTRLTDDWEATQPAHLRHLALIRDTRNTQEKKFVHYVYRTYSNFQQAVDAGEVIWAGVSKPAPKQSSAAKGGRPKKDAGGAQVDAWGFRALNPKDFVDKDGSASLAQCRDAIVLPRKYGPRWDTQLADGIGYDKVDMPKSERTKLKSKPKAAAKDVSSPQITRLESPATPIQRSIISDEATDGGDATPVAAAKVLGLPKLKHETGLLTIDQRVTLGLKPKGRLSKFVEDQIREYRMRTGEPTSIPESIVLERPPNVNTTPILAKAGPLMTKEERIAAGLPARGRLGQKIEDQIRQQRGLPTTGPKIKKPRKSRPANEPALLSKEQRIKLGIIPHGRLPQSLMEGLREERDLEIAFEQSRVIPAYLEAVKDKLPKVQLTRAIDKVRVQTLQEKDPNYDPTRGLDDSDGDDAPVLTEPIESGVADSTTSTPSVEKRKADDANSASQPPKRLRTGREEPEEETGVALTTPPLTVSTAVAELNSELYDQNDQRSTNTEDELAPITVTPPQEVQRKAPTPPRESSPPIIDLAAVDEKIRLIKEKYSHRSVSGIYIDPFAKRKVGQGRPRNAYIATFRLRGLTSLEWFKTEATLAAVEKQGPSPHRSVASPEQEVEVEVQRTDNDERDRAMSSTISTAETSTEATTVRVTLGEDGDSAPDSNAMDVEEPGDPHVTDGTHAFQITPANPEPTILSQQSSEATQTVQPHARPVAGWSAINKPMQPESSYQSPYVSTDHAESTNLDRPQLGVDIEEQETQGNVNDSPIQGVCGPIKEEDMMSRSARKLAAYMGTKTGGGSQKMFRHKIIMQIIDLCDGVYPMHGEIGRPFTTLWKQQYPNVAPPNSSTVLSNLRDMIADKRNGLKKFSFLIRLRQSAGLKKKDMVVYQHLNPTSPQVTKLAYKMANFSSTKAHQYYPEGILHLVSDESFYVPMPVAPKDETVSLERLNPSLRNKIKEANLERRRRYYHKQKNEELARDAQNAGVEAPLKQTAQSDGQPRAKRARLASLNDKNKRYRRAPLSTAPPTNLDPELEESIAEENELVEDELQQRQSLTWKEPWVGPAVGHSVASDNTDLTAPMAKFYVSSITAPIVRFYSTNGTFSTEFGLVHAVGFLGVLLPSKATEALIAPVKGKKRVRIVEPTSQQPSKKIRLGISRPASVAEASLVITPVSESDDSYSSDTSSNTSDSGDDVPLMDLSKAQAKEKAKTKAKVNAKKMAKAERGSTKDLSPTLLERLTGLTGDPDEPVYLPPKPKSKSKKTYRGWTEKKKAHIKEQQRERKYAESQDPVDKFKKLVCTLVIASSMTGAEDRIDWSIVEKVHDAKGFDLAKIKDLWRWMQTNMATQIADLTSDFETRFLEAYENKRIAAIEDPAKYDWPNLVRWAMHTCVYPELSLPAYLGALQQFIVDLSSFEVLDRPRWYRERIADRVRTQLQLQYPFTAPLHQSHTHTKRNDVNEIELKARSWIRANTATPQDRYDSKTAHEKLTTLGDPVLARVVGEYVDRQMLRMRKLKRLLPGRNYTFTARLAKSYGRTFELSEFMAAVKIKKDMDAAFTQDDPEKRLYSVSRAEPDGAIMAVMSLLSDGKVKFAPQIPAVNNEFGAPLPRLSVWGFMEGDYVHRGIDRQRLFWDIHVVPTETYDYGNPLQPASSPLGETVRGRAVWSPLPEPPLPGKHDSNALLPIWSSMDGKQVTWPWWYRILNLVLQPLMFQPGATVEDIHANCDDYTTEIFEIQLVLQWLESVSAVRKVIGGGYITSPSVWAAFGDVLHDLEDDWLNTHVKRKHKKHEKQQWRDKYHLRYSTLQDRDIRPSPSDDDESDARADNERDGAMNASTQIMRRPKEQYAIVREQIAAAASDTSVTDQASGTFEQSAEPEPASDRGADETRIFEAVAIADVDIDMQDPKDAEEVDAEGEMEY